MSKIRILITALAAVIAAQAAPASPAMAASASGGKFARLNTSQVPCRLTSITCAFSITANGSITGIPTPSGTNYCWDPGSNALLPMPCLLTVSGSITTRLACSLSTKIWDDVSIRYRTSTGREFNFGGIAYMDAGQLVFDGSLVDTLDPVHIVHVSGKLINLCGTAPEDMPELGGLGTAAEPAAWGSKGTIRYVYAGA